MKKILMVLACIILITGCGNGVFKEQGNNDGVTFKNAYEESGNIIDANNKMVYITYEELEKLLNKETGILLLSHPKNDLSRQLMPSLIEITNTINTNVYYYEVDIYITNEGLKKLLSSVNEVNNAKRVELPILIFVKNGEIIDYIYGSNDSALLNKNYETLSSKILENYKKLK